MSKTISTVFSFKIRENQDIDQAFFMHDHNLFYVRAKACWYLSMIYFSSLCSQSEIAIKKSVESIVARIYL